MSKSAKVVLAALFVVALFFTASYFFLTYKIDNLKDEKYLQTSIEMKNELQSLIKEKSEAVLLVTLGISANQNIKKILKFKAYEHVELDKLTAKLQSYSSVQKVWFQLISPKGKSFYRSWTPKRGDDLSTIRKDIREMLKEPRVMTTISTGKYDMTFKALVPIFDEGEFLGAIETITKFHSIGQKMKNNGTELLIAVDKRYKKQLTQSYSQTFIDDYYIANPFQNERLFNVVKKSSIDKYIAIDTYVVDKKNHLLITSYKLPDIDGNPMGYFILAKDLKSINTEDIQQTKYSILVISLVVFVLIIILFYYLYSVNHKRFIEKQNQILASNVEEKTKELELQKEVLAFLAYHDSLTGLANRELLLEKVQEAIKQAKKENVCFGVFFLDLDNFKEVNDTYGHEVGDELLLQIKRRLKKLIKDSDTLARLGGDEFAVLYKNATSTSIINLLESILILMKQPFYIKNVEIFTTFSIGVSMFPEDGDSAGKLLRNAETAMYRAKDKGKNAYVFYDKKMTDMAIQRIELDVDIRKALKNREFVAYFQPKIDARNGKIVGLEALIRWIHPKKGLILPGKFIPFCEETGLILQIDKYMLIEAVKQIIAWKKEGLVFGKVSVNVSTKKIESSNYIEELSYIIDSFNVDTSSLELEILESKIMDESSKSIHILNKIRDLGIAISIDDFGTGYSSLSYLKKLPINKIKIDRSFVMDVPKDEDDAALVKTIISLAKNLGLETIAEGVETKEQLEFLLQEGCYDIQGYYFSKPLSAQECKKFIIMNSKGE